MNGSASKHTTPRGDPNLAAIFTWLLPGAGHVYIGRPMFGLLAFAAVEGLYLLGIRLSEGRAFEFLQADLQGPFAGALTPEAGNLGALVWHMRRYGFGPGFPRPWPEHIHLGAWLTAISGMLNVCLMVRAHMDARAPSRARRGLSPDLLVFIGWLVPGLAHVLQGRRARGAVVFLLLVGLLSLGTILAEGSNLDRERHFYYWAGQLLAGAPAMVLELVHGYRRVTGEIRYVDAGLVMVCLAGLLNAMALIDVFSFAEALPPEPERPAERAATEKGAVA